MTDRDLAKVIARMGDMTSVAVPTAAEIARYTEAVNRARVAIDAVRSTVEHLDWMVRGAASNILVFGGFIPSSRMDDHLRLALAAGAQTGISRAEVQRLVVEHYDEDNACRIEEITERLKASAYFEAQHPILDDSLVAYRAHLDAMGYIPLVVMIEGVSLPWVKKVAPYLDRLADMADAYEHVLKELEGKRLKKGQAWNRETELKQLMGQMKSKPTERDIAVAIDGMLSILLAADHLEGIGRLSDVLREQVYRPTAKPGNELVGGPSRHVAAHTATPGARADTVACYLYLDALATLFDETDSSISEYGAEQSGP